VDPLGGCSQYPCQQRRRPGPPDGGTGKGKRKQGKIGGLGDWFTHTRRPTSMALGRFGDLGKRPAFSLFIASSSSPTQRR